MKKINVYDFDKTLYKKDASLEFWKYCVWRKKILILLFPYQIFFLIFNKLNLVSTKKFKEKFFIFLKFISKEEVDLLLEKFWTIEFQNMNSAVMNTLSKENLENVCISASPRFLLEIPCRKMGIDLLIGTDLDLKNFKIIGENCKGNQKIVMLNKYISDYRVENFYSDSLSDLPLFNISKNKFWVKNGRVKILNENRFYKK